MGEIADAMLNGEMCETCGQELGEGVGFPRSCCDETHYNYRAEMQNGGRCKSQEVLWALDQFDMDTEVGFDDIELIAMYLHSLCKDAKKRGIKFNKQEQTLVNSVEKVTSKFLKKEDE